MARQRVKIYRRRRPVRTFFKILGIVVAALIVLAIVVFIWFRQYIWYTSDGIRLDVPFLREILDELPEDAQRDPIVTPEPVPEEPVPDEELEAEEEIPQGVEPVRTLILETEDFYEDVDWDIHLRGQAANGLMTVVKDQDGQLYWDSGVAMATSYMVNGTEDPAAVLAALEEAETRTAAVYCFADELMAERNTPAALDLDGTAWLDPANADIQAYITDLCVELVELGFNEILLLAYAYPPDYTDLSQAEQDEVIVDFLTGLSRTLTDAGAELALLTEDYHWLGGGDAEDSYSLDLDALAGVVDRFYCSPTDEDDPEDQTEALLTAAEALLGEDYATRFVVASTFTPSDGVSRFWTYSFGSSGAEDDDGLVE